MIPERIIEHWASPGGILFKQRRLVFLKDANKETVVFMPIWELDYYRWLCGNVFVYRSVTIGGRIEGATRIIIPDNVMRSLPTVMFRPDAERFDYSGLCVSRDTFRTVGRYREMGFNYRTEFRHLTGPDGPSWAQPQ